MDKGLGYVFWLMANKNVHKLQKPRFEAAKTIE